MTTTIDLRSDAISHPTPGMRAAMAAAVVGDEQKREDPSVLELERRVADLLGQDDAVFLPSATMANQIALKVLTIPGDEVLADARAHLFRNEAGAPAVWSGLAMGRIDNKNGIFDGNDVRAEAIIDNDPHHPQTTVVSVENTHNASGGRVWTVEQHADVVVAARQLGLSIHLDGARLLNAALALGVPATSYGSSCDTVTLCLSKGLGCPVGALLACRQPHASKVRRLKHLFGGAMRQAGILAAAGLYALDYHVERLAEDHDNAKLLAEALIAAGVPVLNVPESNIVLIDVGALGHSRVSAADAFRAAGVLCSHGSREGVLRAMTHLEVSHDDVLDAAARLGAAVAGVNRRARLRVSDISRCKPVRGVPGLATHSVVGERAMLNVSVLDPGATIELHSHPNEQVGIVLSGAVTLTVDGEVQLLGTGGAYRIGAGAPHSLVAGPEGVRLVDTFHPLREEYRKFDTGVDEPTTA